MATQHMLIDATHREETRVVVLHEDRLKEYDLEVASRKQLKGNIYLAKVTRVEPSLQAAFIEYGGNRHGFLSFSEIHPDYYQIPVADREAVVAEHDAAEKVDDDAGASDGEGASSDVEVVGGDDTEDAEVRRRKAPPRRYRIQEVIKARQILLVQVVKEERGNKGAALTTYLSLAGRYSVLMPNTARGGGISRKINNGATRRRLKTILGGLDIPDGMGVIVRTAGEERNKAEIKRDYDYLLRLWSSVRDLTLKSSA
ncbi:MAG: ribonuclease E/G, partial [Rhodospirillales bacterium]|nr:ribonuclease E/G [Rhodospirillales bacterium]